MRLQAVEVESSGIFEDWEWEMFLVFFRGFNNGREQSEIRGFRDASAHLFAGVRERRRGHQLV
jgi:hypothetical protein